MVNKITPRSPRSNEGELLQQTQRLLAWSAYQESLKDVDQKAQQQFQLTVASLRTALWIRVGIYILQLGVVSAALFVGLFQVVQSQSENYLGLGISLASFLLLAILLFRNPIKAMNRILVDFARVQIILQGYARQVNQVDITFKQAFLEKKVDIMTVTKSLAQVQKVMDGNVESLLQFLEELQF